MTLHLEQIVVSEEGQSGFREGQSLLAEIANKWNHQVFRKHYIIAIGASSEPIFSDYVSTTLSVFVWSDWEIKLVFCRRQAWLVNGGRKCYRNPFYQVATRQLLLGNQFSNFYWATNFPTFIAPLPIFSCHRGFSSRNEKEKLNGEIGIPGWSTYSYRTSLYASKYRDVDCGGQICLQNGERIEISVAELLVKDRHHW